MNKTKRLYQEGTWFAVPLQSGGYAVGLVARVSRHGEILGYFFGPRHATVPPSEEITRLSTSDAILIAKASEFGLTKDGWPILATCEPWHPERWPMPYFYKTDVLVPGTVMCVEYSEKDPLEYIGETRITREEARLLPEDVFYGHIALQVALDRCLPGRSDSGPMSPPTNNEYVYDPSTDFFDDDVAADVKVAFENAISSGLAPGDAADRVLGSMKEYIEDVDDRPKVLQALKLLLSAEGVSAQLIEENLTPDEGHRMTDD